MASVLIGLAPSAKAHFGCPTASAIAGTNGDDFLEGDGQSQTNHDHKDSIDGLSGNDTIEGYSCGDTLFGSLQYDEIHGGHGPDNVYGGGWADSVSVLNQGLFGGDGDDLVDGGEDGDSLLDETGPDTDTLKGGGGDDNLWGFDGDFLDTLKGEAPTTTPGDFCEFDRGGGNQDSLAGCELEIPNPGG
jgi:Ca2+-binding RTX toxin-like protein